MTAEAPDDIAALKALLAETRAALAASEAALAERTAALARVEEARRRLELIVDELRRARFGARSEKRGPEQYALPLEDVDIAQGVLDAAQERADATLEASRPGRRSVKRLRGRLPAHLPRVERVIEPGSTSCPCGCGPMARIGEDVSERLDVVPAQFRVLVTRRPRYACRRCRGAVVQAPAPERVVPGGLPTEALIAHVVVSKFADHLPFYRQSQIYARQGVDLDRATLGAWAGRACFHLQPVVERMREHLGRAERLFMDETTAPVLDPGRGRTKTGFLWAIASDDRGHGSPDPPVVLFRYAPGRGGVWAERFLEGFSGRPLQCDGYEGYERLTRLQRPMGPWTLVHCWSHLRRRFVQVACTTRSPVADEALNRVGELYAVEKAVRGLPPEVRLAARRDRSAPIVAALKPWLEAQLSHLSSGCRLAEHIRYALRHWDGLIRFLDDGRLKLDTNPVENLIRPIALTRKNALFAGHEVGAENWALLASLLATCKLSAVDPAAYVAATLQAIVDGHPQNAIDDLMPWRFAPAAPPSSRAA